MGFLVLHEDTKYAVCNACQAKVPRGGNSTKLYTTTNLVNHLSTKHPEVNSQYVERKTSKEARPPRETRKRLIQHQLSLEETQELTKLWDINDSKSQRVHKRIGEMIAVDCQPLSVVEDIEFTRVLQVLEPWYKFPSRKYFTESVIPKIYNGMRAEVTKLVDETKYVSFTTDIWSSSVNNTSLLNLTAHWISDSFIKVSAVLHAQPVQESHTGEYIAAQMNYMLQKWFLKRFT